ncbi:MAG: hypothetical protein ACYSTS_17485 [Planctomycetota bacterium]|jgi:hypothetical protein
MITDSASLILFAIQSAVRLGQQARTAYVDSTRRRELILPLPDFFSSPDVNDAIAFFDTIGKRFVDGYERDGQFIEGSKRLKSLISLALNQTLKDEKKKNELKTFHTEFWNLNSAERGDVVWKDGGYVDPEQINALITIRQWRRDADQFSSTLHRMAATIIELGIDYALTSPDLFDKNSTRGKVLTSFLQAIDDINFQETNLSELPFKLFVATMETATEHPDIFSGDQKVQELVRTTTNALSKKVSERIKEINNSDMDVFEKRIAIFRVEDWAELTFRSILSSGGRLVVSNPERFLGVKDSGGQALVTNVGGSFLDLILNQENEMLDTVFSREALETILKAALKTVGEHPDIILDIDDNDNRIYNQGLLKLLSQIATDLSKVENLLNRDILPEIARMTLERTGENLELLWPDYKDKPENNLLLKAAKTTLEILSRKPNGSAKWKLKFSSSDLLSVTETVIDELVANPGWLIDEANEINNVLGDVLNAALNVLRNRGDNRLNSNVARDILREVIKTAALRKEFLDKLPHDHAEAGERLIIAAIDAVLATIFHKDLDAKAAWQLVRSEIITGLVKVSLNQLAKAKLDADIIAKLEDILMNEVKALVEGKSFDLDAFSIALSEISVS